MDVRMRNKCNYWLTLCLALATVMMPSGVAFSRDCPCLQGKCNISLASDDHPAQCCCESPSNGVNHKSKDKSSSDNETPTGKCSCCFPQIVNSSTVILFSPVSWIANKAIRTCQYRSHTSYTSNWVLKILRPPSC
jgi:hypothetical protein